MYTVLICYPKMSFVLSVNRHVIPPLLVYDYVNLAHCKIERALSVPYMRKINMAQKIPANSEKSGSLL